MNTTNLLRLALLAAVLIGFAPKLRRAQTVPCQAK
jgi:hypothetical protein